jgi:hypothetical protein
LTLGSKRQIGGLSTVTWHSPYQLKYLIPSFKKLQAYDFVPIILLSILGK